MTNAPIVGTFGCCALAASGHAAAAPPSRVMNSRRFIAVSEAHESYGKCRNSGSNHERPSGPTQPREDR
jgi:hypothetical protein